MSLLKDENVIQQLLEADPPLQSVFTYVKNSNNPFANLPKPPYVALIGAIIGQIIRYNEAKRIRGNLYKHFGNNFTRDDIENATDETWIKIGLDPSKIGIINRTNEYLETTNNQLATIEEIQDLKNIKGIGDWTIETVLLTSMLDWDIFPARDVFLRKKIQKLYKLKKRPTEKETKIIAEKWKPYRSVVTWYMWRWVCLIFHRYLAITKHNILALELNRNCV